MGFSRGVGHTIFLIFNLGNEKSMRIIIFIIYFFYIKDFFAFFWRFLWQIYRQIVLLPLWINCLHGWFLKPVFFDCNFAISWGQPERLPSETIPIRRIFSAVICLWAPVCDLICIILMAWMYFLQVFAISREIVADAKATKRTKTMHEIFIFFACGSVETGCQLLMASSFFQPFIYSNWTLWQHQTAFWIRNF